MDTGKLLTKEQAMEKAYATQNCDKFADTLRRIVGGGHGETERINELTKHPKIKKWLEDPQVSSSAKKSFFIMKARCEEAIEKSTK